MKPILFNTAMVRAILDGRKTQTRRVVKPQPVWIADPNVPFKTEDADPKGVVKSPYSKGDVLYVRETWADVDVEYVLPTGEWGCRNETIYRASSEKFTPEFGWRPNIHMPKEAARLFLRVTDVRVQRVQSISEADAVTEGVLFHNGYWCGAPHPVKGHPKCRITAREAFLDLWDSINDKHGFGCDTNPWVWVYDFERIEKSEALKTPTSAVDGLPMGPTSAGG